MSFWTFFFKLLFMIISEQSASLFIFLYIFVNLQSSAILTSYIYPEIYYYFRISGFNISNKMDKYSCIYFDWYYKTKLKVHAYKQLGKVWFYLILWCITNVMTVPLATTMSTTVVFIVQTTLHVTNWQGTVIDDVFRVTPVRTAAKEHVSDGFD